MSIHVKQNASLAANNAMRFDVSARWYCEAVTLEDVHEALAFARDKGVQPIILGEGTNTVFISDIDTLVIRNKVLGYTVNESGLVDVASGENWHGLVRSTIAAGWYGLENLALIPGTVGAAPMQNIGAYGVELSMLCDSVEVVELASGSVFDLKAADCGFAYRDSLFKQEALWFITRVRLNLHQQDRPSLEYPGIAEYIHQQGWEISSQSVMHAVCDIRREKLPDPQVLPNAGSFFKNPLVDAAKAQDLLARYPQLPVFDAEHNGALGEPEPVKKVSAAWLIDRLGLKGLGVGGMMVSDNHALVIVNPDNGKPEDLLQLKDTIIEKVRAEYGVILEVEPRIYPSTR